MDAEDWMAMRKLISRHLSLAPYQQAFDSLRNTCNTRFADEVEQILREIENVA